jgi:hypothetical protein
MKSFILVSLIACSTVFAQELKTCSSEEIHEIKTSQDHPDMSSRFYLLNSSNRVVGSYFTDNEGGTVMEVCDSFTHESEDYIASSAWYYWESDVSSDPSTWVSGNEMTIEQDEGRVELLVLSERRLKLKVLALGSDEQTAVMAEDIVTLRPIK